MYPCTTYDKQNGLAYIAFSCNEIERSMESEDELFVLDLDKNGELVGIEVLSVFLDYLHIQKAKAETQKMYSIEEVRKELGFET